MGQTVSIQRTRRGKNLATTEDAEDREEKSRSEPVRTLVSSVSSAVASFAVNPATHVKRSSR
jgi:hypothetical protein